jgi:hypothetical protein
MLELIRPLVPISLAAWEDYVKNAVHFSAQEMEILQELLEELDENHLRTFVSSHFPADFFSKRELSDLCRKLTN